MVNSQPLDGSAFELEVAGNDGATIGWSSLAFAAQPLDVAAGAILAPVRVAVLNPAGDTALLTANPTTAPQDERTDQLVRHLRS